MILKFKFLVFILVLAILTFGGQYLYHNGSLTFIQTANTQFNTLLEQIEIVKNSKKAMFRSHGTDNEGIVKNVNVDETQATKPAKKEANHEDGSAVTSGEANEKISKTKKENVKAGEDLPQCLKRGNKLVGKLSIDQSVPDIKELESTMSVTSGGSVENGGFWKPTTCQPRVKVAIIIPYRNRDEQLRVFLRHMHPFLMRQQLYYQIFVVEQLKDDPFNRAGLFNVGYTEALKVDKDFNCFIFTDVDLLPEDDRNYYGCPTSPRHLSVAVDKFHYRLPYETIFGGVAAFMKDDFLQINGMSNLFWGWGGEDDDLYSRITTSGFHLTRPSMLVGRYTMVKFHHFQSSKADPNRMNLLKNSDARMTVDGLNALRYDLVKVDKQPLVTFIKIVLSKSMYNM